MEQISLSELISQLSIGLDAVEATLAGASKYHGKRISLLSIAIGRYLQYNEQQIFGLASCALLHDNALTEYILSEKKGNTQQVNLRAHCIFGEENMRFFPFYEDVKGYILYHHECVDGSGPFGKREGEYKREAEIIALADQIDVRFNLGKKDTAVNNIINYIKKYEGTKYSSWIVDTVEQVLTSSLMEKLRDENISTELNNYFPIIYNELTNKEIVNLAGIVAKIIDYKSNFTKEHTMQIANKAWYMAKVYNYDELMCAKIYLAAALHDFGKLFIPSEILEKPGKLTEEEFETIKLHVKYTWDCIHQVRGLEEIALWASEHHEKLNGNGYPFGKKANELDFVSRLLACLDIYQAVREKRPYHPERTHEETIEVLAGMADKGFVDASIITDLDKNLCLFDHGYVAFPEIMDYSEKLI